MDSDCAKVCLNFFFTIYPVILDDRSNFVELSHKPKQNKGQQHIPTVAMSNTHTQAK